MYEKETRKYEKETRKYEKETRKAKHEKGIYSSSCVAVLLLSAASVQWTHAEVVDRKSVV